MISLLLGLFFSEILARCTPSPIPTRVLHDGLEERRCLAPSRSRHWAPIPGECGADSLGLHRLSSTIPGEPLRLLLLGDSISTHTLWVESMRQHLEQALQGPIELANAGVSGYDTCQELATFSELGERYRPQVVVLQTCPNDALSSGVLMLQDSHTFSLLVGERMARVPNWALRSRIMTWAFLMPAIRGAEPGRRNHAPQCLDALARSLQERSVPHFVLLFPALVDSGDPARGEWQAERSLVEQVAMTGAPYLDLRGPLEQEGPLPGLRFRPEDTLHPNEKAQAIVGPVAAKAIMEAGVLRAVR